MSSRFAEMEARLDTSRKSPEYLMEAAVEAALDQIAGRLGELGWNDADLARVMGVSRTRVHHMLRGDTQNFTIRSLAGLATALGTGLSINFPPRGYVAVPIYRPAEYTKSLAADVGKRTKVSMGRTTLEGPNVAVDASRYRVGAAA